MSSCLPQPYYTVVLSVRYHSLTAGGGQRLGEPTSPHPRQMSGITRRSVEKQVLAEPDRVVGRENRVANGPWVIEDFIVITPLEEEDMD